VLPNPVSASTYIRDTQRVPSRATATTTGAAHLRALLPVLHARGVRVLLVQDRSYSGEQNA
jgi:hypothetical protein